MQAYFGQGCYICVKHKNTNTMKKHFLLALVATFVITISLRAQDNLSALIPMVNSVQLPKGKPVQLKKQAKIALEGEDLEFSYHELKRILADRMGVQCELVALPKADFILKVDSTIEGDEQYKVDVNNKRVLLAGKSKVGVFYAVQTLNQLLMGDVMHTKQSKIQQILIDDQPRYPFRGLMVDPARHFLPLKDLKFFIDKMAAYKYNKLQLHLTDDQGWRMEIKSHPKLTEAGAFYTQEELKELIAYASLRNIEVIPEMDVPGHVVALLAQYPELGCTNTQHQEKVVGKTESMMLCAANDEVYRVYADIIREVAQVFPAKLIHMGGDEARIGKNWLQCDKCKQKMKELNYTDGAQLMIPFFKEIKKIVSDNNKELMLWCELDSEYAPASEYLFPYDKDITLVTWRWGLTPTCLELTAKHGNPIIMAPGEFAYLDYPQLKGDLPEFNNWGMPVTTLTKTYQLDPGYGYPEEQQNHVQGILGTLWGEAMKDINRVTYMAFPRALALAEAGWTNMENRTWESFVQRMYPNLQDLMQAGVFIRVPFEIVER